MQNQANRIRRFATLRGVASTALKVMAVGSLTILWLQPAGAKPKPWKPRPMLFGKANVPAASTTTALNINTAGKPELSPLPVLSSEAKAAIVNFRTGGPYSSGADLATKVCSRMAVDFGPTDIVIGSAVYQGFKCAVAASGTYWANGGTHLYTVAVEVTGSATVPPAPPAQ